MKPLHVLMILAVAAVTGFSQQVPMDEMIRPIDRNVECSYDENNPFSVSGNHPRKNSESEVERSRLREPAPYTPPSTVFLNDGEWHWLNPLPQGNDLLDIQVLNEDIIYAVGEYGTFIKTVDGGDNWTVSHNIAGTIHDLTKLQFVDPDTGWVALFPAYGTWQWDWSAFPVNMLKTTDGGETWIPINTLPSHPSGEQPRVHDFYFKDANWGLAVGGNRYVAQTRDGGLTWTTISYYPYSPVPAISSLAFKDDMDGYAAYGEWMLHTPDFGSTWDDDPAGHYTGTPHDLHFCDAQNGFFKDWGWTSALGNYVEYHWTHDGGLNWTDVIHVDGIAEVDSYFETPLHGWMIGGTDVFSATRVLETHDGGQTWEEDDFNEPCFEGHESATKGLECMDVAPDGTLWCAGEQGYLTRYDTLTGEWQRQSEWPQQIDFETICFVSPTTGWAFEDWDGMLFKTEDGGMNWQVQEFEKTTQIHSLYFFDERHGWAGAVQFDIPGDWSTSESIYLRTDDGGANWQQIVMSEEVLNWNGWSPGAFYFLNPLEGWACAGACILHTTDGGLNWDIQDLWTLNDDYDKNGIYFYDSMHGLAIGNIERYNHNGQAIYYTNNGGETWNRNELGDKVVDNWGLTSVCMVNETVGWVCGGGWKPTVQPGTWYRPTLLKTEDGGQSWEFQELGTWFATLRGITFLNENEGWAVGNDEYGTFSSPDNASTILHTVDGGENWEITHTYYNLNALSFLDADLGWAAGKNGTLIRWGDGTLINQPPVITSPASASAVEDVPFTYTAQAHDPHRDPLIFEFSQVPHWLSAEGQTLTGTPLQGDADTSFTVTVSDGELSDTLTVAITVTPVNDPPVLVSPDSVTAVINEPFTYIVRTFDEEGDSVTIWFGMPDFNIVDTSFTWLGNPAWLTVIDSMLTGTPAPGTQDTVVALSLFDAGHCVFDTLKITILEETERPVIISADSATAVEDSLFQYTVESTNPGQGNLAYTFRHYPSWLTPRDSLISGIPTEGMMDTCFTAVIMDGEYEDTLRVALRVLPVNDPPVINSPGRVTAQMDSLFRYTARAIDPEDSTLIFQFLNAPQWLAFSDSVISGTPGIGAVDTSFQVVASDGELRDTLRVHVDVIAVNHPPVITSADTAYATEDLLFTYRPEAMDTDGSVPVFHFLSYPSWLSASDSLISGTPVQGTADTFFVFDAFDGLASDTLKVTLLISPVNDPPVISGLTAWSMDNTQQIQVALDTCVTDADDADSVLVWSVTCDCNPVQLDLDERVLTISAPGWSGQAALTLRVEDPAGAADSTTVALEVKDASNVPHVSGAVPLDFELRENYPNPFNPETSITFGLPRVDDAVVEIFNIRGECVDVLIQGKLPAGYHRLTWNARNRSSGTYLIRFKGGGKVLYRKCLLLK